MFNDDIFVVLENAVSYLEYRYVVCQSRQFSKVVFARIKCRPYHRALFTVLVCLVPPVAGRLAAEWKATQVIENASYLTYKIQ